MDIADLRDYPVNGIHQHHMILANYCKGRGASEEEALDLLYGKYQQKPQRRGLSSRKSRMQSQRHITQVIGYHMMD